MDKKLDRIEAQLQNLFEDKLVKILTGRRPGETLIERLVEVLQDNLKQDHNGIVIAPDQYVIYVNPVDLPDWRSHHDLLAEIAQRLQENGAVEGLQFAAAPVITVESDPQISNHGFLINVGFSDITPPLPDTAAMQQSLTVHAEDRVPEGAYLIVSGEMNVPLHKMVVNIGRHSENDLVLHDPHISRQHAQLRIINGCYVIFDAGSTGGIFLNGKRISQATLQSGDVIRIGMTNLIYVQEHASEEPTTAFSPDEEGAHQ